MGKERKSIIDSRRKTIHAILGKWNHKHQEGKKILRAWLGGPVDELEPNEENVIDGSNESERIEIPDSEASYDIEDESSSSAKPPLSFEGESHSRSLTFTDPILNNEQFLLTASPGESITFKNPLKPKRFDFLASQTNCFVILPCVIKVEDILSKFITFIMGFVSSLNCSIQFFGIKHDQALGCNNTSHEVCSSETDLCTDLRQNLARLYARISREQQSGEYIRAEECEDGCPMSLSNQDIHENYSQDLNVSDETEYWPLGEVLIPKLINLNAARGSTSLQKHNIRRDDRSNLHSKSLFALRLSRVALSNHPLMLQEEKIYQKLLCVYHEYRSRIDSGFILELKSIVQEKISPLLTFKNERECQRYYEVNQSVSFDPNLVELAECLSILLDELHTINKLALLVWDYWELLQIARNEQGFECTFCDLKAFRNNNNIPDETTGNLVLENEPQGPSSSMQRLLEVLNVYQSVSGNNISKNSTLLSCMSSMVQAIELSSVEKLNILMKSILKPKGEGFETQQQRKSEIWRRKRLSQEKYHVEFHVNGVLVSATEKVNLNWPSYQISFDKTIFCCLSNVDQVVIKLFRTRFGFHEVIATNRIFVPNFKNSNATGVSKYHFCFLHEENSISQKYVIDGDLLVESQIFRAVDGDDTVDKESPIRCKKREFTDAVFKPLVQSHMTRFVTTKNQVCTNIPKGSKLTIHDQRGRQSNMEFKAMTKLSTTTNSNSQNKQIESKRFFSFSEIVREFKAESSFDMGHFVSSLFLPQTFSLRSTFFPKKQKIKQIEILCHESSNEHRLQVTIHNVINVPRRPSDANQIGNRQELLARVCFRNSTGDIPLASGSIRPKISAVSFSTGSTSAVQHKMADHVKIALFDKYQVDLRDNGGFYVDELTVSSELRYLGSVSIPYMSVQREGIVEKFLKLSVPDFIIGYCRNREENAYKLAGDIAVDIDPCLEEKLAELSFLASVEPDSSKEQKPFFDEMESTLLEHSTITNAAADFCKDIRTRYPYISKRKIQVVVSGPNGDPTLVSQFLYAANGPSNCDTDWKCAYYVSLIPFEDSILKRKSWVSCKRFLDRLVGNWSEHAVLLANMMINLIQTSQKDSVAIYLAFGTTLTDGDVVRVIKDLLTCLNMV